MNWESGDLAAFPGYAMINELCGLAVGFSAYRRYDLEAPYSSESMMLRSKYCSVQGVSGAAHTWHMKYEEQQEIAPGRGALPAR